VCLVNATLEKQEALSTHVHPAAFQANLDACNGDRELGRDATHDNVLNLKDMNQKFLAEIAKGQAQERS
jgi:hypothetical protein